nr:immunoglobulin light chain junction region [Macaca mulatta]
FLQTKNFPWTF